MLTKDQKNELQLVLRNDFVVQALEAIGKSASQKASDDLLNYKGTDSAELKSLHDRVRAVYDYHQSFIETLRSYRSQPDVIKPVNVYSLLN